MKHDPLLLTNNGFFDLLTNNGCCLAGTKIPRWRDETKEQYDCRINKSCAAFKYDCRGKRVKQREGLGSGEINLGPVRSPTALECKTESDCTWHCT